MLWWGAAHLSRSSRGTRRTTPSSSHGWTRLFSILSTSFRAASIACSATEHVFAYSCSRDSPQGLQLGAKTRLVQATVQTALPGRPAALPEHSAVAHHQQVPPVRLLPPAQRQPVQLRRLVAQQVRHHPRRRGASRPEVPGLELPALVSELLQGAQSEVIRAI